MDEVLRLEALYKQRYDGWNVRHFYGRYQRDHKGERSYTWVKSRLQSAELVPKGNKKWDLIVTMDAD